jgi:hypothetical protein
VPDCDRSIEGGDGWDEEASGFWGTGGEEVTFADVWDDAASCGMDYFEEFDLPLEQFLFGKPGVRPLSELLGLEGPLRPMATLAVRIAQHAFQGGTQLTPEEMRLLQEPVQFTGLPEIKPQPERVESFFRIMESLELKKHS